MAEGRLLVVDDDVVALDLLVEVLRGEGYTVHPAAGAREGIEIAAGHPLDAALVDLRMPDMDGIQVLKEIKRRQTQDLPVILLTAFADMSTASAAIHAGAFEYLSKPFRMEEIKAIMSRVLSTGRAGGNDAAAGAVTAGQPLAGLIGKSPAMVAVYKRVARLSSLDVTVLVTGETGTGKEQVARAIHLDGARAALPFVVVDCASLPEQLFEAEVFGHERGAFTGAQARRLGIMETAGAGTCFLDEIGELPALMQGKLLRVLQERTIRRVGGNQTIDMPARIIAATNRDLAAMVSEGRFREDLYYRLNIVEISLPALRERAEDIPLLIGHFLAKSAARNGGRTARLAPETLQRLVSYGWPGNVRQLENVIQRVVALCPSPIITLDDLPDEILGAAPVSAARREPEHTANAETHGAPTLDEARRRRVFEVLAQLGGNKLQAARILGIDRRTLYRILAREKAGRPE